MKIVTILQKWQRRRNEFFSQCLLHPVVFQKRKHQPFWSSFGSCSLQLPDQLQHDCVRMSLLKTYQYNSGYLVACRKWQLKLWNIMQSLFKLINKCTRTIEHRFAKVFLKPFLSLLTGKCWLGKAALTFCQINTVMSTYACNVTHRFNESKNLTVM